MMAFISPSPRLSSVSISFSISRGVFTPISNPNLTPNPIVFSSKEVSLSPRTLSLGTLQWKLAASNICKQEPIGVDLSFPSVKECFSDEELHAAVSLRIRTFYDFNQSFGVEFSNDGKDCVVVGTLDVNQCLRLADELIGKKPEGIGAGLKRGYLSNVCVAKELQRNGLGHALVSKSKNVARHWGITDLYVHVAADNEAAQKLYEKSGFIYENEEPAWQARFLGRPRRFLLWADLRLAK